MRFVLSWLWMLDKQVSDCLDVNEIARWNPWEYQYLFMFGCPRSVIWHCLCRSLPCCSSHITVVSREPVSTHLLLFHAQWTHNTNHEELSSMEMRTRCCSIWRIEGGRGRARTARRRRVARQLVSGARSAGWLIDRGVPQLTAEWGKEGVGRRGKEEEGAPLASRKKRGTPLVWRA
jgi:hypothetical protein